jgi:hypothetical protein
VLWRELYDACVLETNLEKLEKLAFETEGAIFLRSRVLSHDSYRSGEVQALKQAAKVLLEIKTEKLGWPDPTEFFTHKAKRGFLVRTIGRAMNRVRSASLVAEHLWVEWVFKPSKRKSKVADVSEVSQP